MVQLGLSKKSTDLKHASKKGGWFLGDQKWISISGLSGRVLSTWDWNFCVDMFDGVTCKFCLPQRHLIAYQYYCRHLWHRPLLTLTFLLAPLVFRHFLSLTTVSRRPRPLKNNQTSKWWRLNIGRRQNDDKSSLSSSLPLIHTVAVTPTHVLVHFALLFQGAPTID